MEKITGPEHDDETGSSLEEVASALEQTAINIIECEREIAEAEEFLRRSSQEFGELVQELDQNDAEYGAQLEGLNKSRSDFFETVRVGIARMNEIKTQLKRVHAEQLKMFERLKAAKRQKEFGISGTAH